MDSSARRRNGCGGKMELCAHVYLGALKLSRAVMNGAAVAEQ